MLRHAPVILEERRITLEIEVTDHIANENSGRTASLAESEFRTGAARGAIGIPGEEVLQRVECDGSFSVGGDIRSASIIQDFAAELEGVLAAEIRDMIQ